MLGESEDAIDGELLCLVDGATDGRLDVTIGTFVGC